jgi:hypothetical protein
MKIDLNDSELQTLLAALEFYTKAMNHDYVESDEVDWMAGDEAELSDRLSRRISRQNDEETIDTSVSASVNPFDSHPVTLGEMTND